MTLRAILTDIEGTTSSIAFVKTVLFPYAAQHLADYVRKHRTHPVVAEALTATAVAARLPEDDEEALIRQLLRWIEEDSKATPLKTLQGLIWTAGYQQGDYRAHIYPEAAEMLHRWHEQGMALHVYSSGSVRAQQLFFRYSEAGDLTPLFSGYFDTTIGAKQDQNSYLRIQQEIGFPAGQILFLSDSIAELDAARSAGLQTCWLQRPNDLPNPPAREDHPRAGDFKEVDILVQKAVMD